MPHSSEHLDNINEGPRLHQTHSGLNVLVLDVSNRDFVHSQADYVWVLEQVNKAAKTSPLQ